MILVARRVRERKNKEMVKCTCLIFGLHSNLTCVMFILHSYLFSVFSPRRRFVLQTEISDKHTLQFYISSYFFLSPSSCHKDELTVFFNFATIQQLPHDLHSTSKNHAMQNNDCTGQPTIRSSFLN